MTCVTQCGSPPAFFAPQIFLGCHGVGAHSAWAKVFGRCIRVDVHSPTPLGAVESAFGFVALSQSCLSICRRMPQGGGGALLGHGVVMSGSRFQLQRLCM